MVLEDGDRAHVAHAALKRMVQRVGEACARKHHDDLPRLRDGADAHREALDSSIPAALDHYLANYADLLARWDTVLAEKGVKKVEIADSVIAEFRAKAADPIRDAWISDMEAQGLPGQELYDLVVKTLAEAKAAN